MLYRIWNRTDQKGTKMELHRKEDWCWPSMFCWAVQQNHGWHRSSWLACQQLSQWNLRKKWWFPLFVWPVDVSIQNAWLLGSEANCKDCDNLLTFRRSIAIYYLKHYGSEPKRPGRQSSKAPAETELRFDGMNPFVMGNEGNVRRRCACVIVEVYMAAKNAKEIFAQSVLKTTTRSAKWKSSW